MSIQMPRGAVHSVHSATLADVLERVPDKGLVIAGDINADFRGRATFLVRTQFFRRTG
jgi:Gas vesicle protein